MKVDRTLRRNPFHTQHTSAAACAKVETEEEPPLPTAEREKLGTIAAQARTVLETTPPCRADVPHPPPLANPDDSASP